VLCVRFLYSSLFLLDLPATAQIYTLSLHDALPIFPRRRPVHRRSSDARARPVRRKCPMSAGAAADRCVPPLPPARDVVVSAPGRSEEHTSELQSRENLVCRLLLEKKKEDVSVTQRE